MKLHVLGCHGGETPKHRTSAFVLDGKLAIDAGALTSELSLREQYSLEAVVVSHAHMDHIRDLATVADNRVQVGAKPLTIAGTRATLTILKKHFFNDLLWPDFTKIASKGKQPTIRYQELPLDAPSKVAGYAVTPIAVTHTIDCSGFIVERDGKTIAYSGDTGPTDKLWKALDRAKNLRALLMELSFPNAQQKLATASGHHTPQTLIRDFAKFKKIKDLPVLIYHIKPNFEREVERECRAIKGVDLTLLRLGDRFLL